MDRIGLTRLCHQPTRQLWRVCSFCERICNNEFQGQTTVSCPSLWTILKKALQKKLVSVCGSNLRNCLPDCKGSFVIWKCFVSEFYFSTLARQFLLKHIILFQAHEAIQGCPIYGSNFHVVRISYSMTMAKSMFQPWNQYCDCSNKRIWHEWIRNCTKYVRFSVGWEVLGNNAKIAVSNVIRLFMDID